MNNSLSGLKGVHSDTLLLDTVHILSTDFTINGVNDNWDYGQYRYDAFSDSGEGHPYGGFTDKGTGCCVKIHAHDVRVELNVRRIVHSSNLYPVTVVDFDIVTEYLQDLLSSLGIVANLTTAVPARVDLARDLTLPYAVFHFIRGISDIYKVGHLRQHACPEFYDEPYARYGNKQRDITFYQKDDDQRVRSEVRYKKPESCRRHGFATYASLSDPHLQLRQWRHENIQLVKLADDIGLTSLPPQSADIATRIREIVNSKGSRLSDVAYLLAGMGGYSTVMEVFGGFRGVSKWLTALIDPTLRHRSKRVLKHFQRIAREAEWFEGVVPDINVWADYQAWIESSPNVTTPISIHPQSKGDTE